MVGQGVKLMVSFSRMCACNYQRFNGIAAKAKTKCPRPKTGDSQNFGKNGDIFSLTVNLIKIHLPKKNKKNRDRDR